MTMITKERADALIVRKQPEAAIRKWLNQEALGAYGANLVDDPEDHEAAKADNLIGALAETVIALQDLRAMVAAGPPAREAVEMWIKAVMDKAASLKDGTK